MTAGGDKMKDPENDVATNELRGYKFCFEHSKVFIETSWEDSTMSAMSTDTDMPSPPHLIPVWNLNRTVFDRKKNFRSVRNISVTVI